MRLSWRLFDEGFSRTGIHTLVRRSGWPAKSDESSLPYERPQGRGTTGSSTTKALDSAPERSGNSDVPPDRRRELRPVGDGRQSEAFCGAGGMAGAELRSAPPGRVRVGASRRETSSARNRD